MSHDPSHHPRGDTPREPPRQDRWPTATPEEGWPAYSGRGDYLPATAGYRSAYGYGGVAGGYERGAEDAYYGNGNGYHDPTTGYGGAWDGSTWDRYPGAADDFAGQDPGTGYQDQGGYLDQNQYLDQAEYLKPIASGALLVAPDSPGERGWRPRRSQARDRDLGRGGLVVGAVTGFLAAAVAIGASTLAAAFVRPQAAPVIAVGGAFIDRTPSAVKNFAVQHFGENDKTMLLLGMYVTIALLAMVIGCLSRRNAAIGVGGIAAFGLLGAFVAVTRPESRPADVIPSVIGGLAGIAAFAWLACASAPAAPVRHARAARRRRAW
jgi:hypothetical protein